MSGAEGVADEALNPSLGLRVRFSPKASRVDYTHGYAADEKLMLWLPIFPYDLMRRKRRDLFAPKTSLHALAYLVLLPGVPTVNRLIWGYSHGLG